MMESARPIYNYISFSRYDKVSSIDASPSCQTAKIIKPFKSWTIKSLVYFEDWSQLDIFSNFHPFLLRLAGILFYYSVSFRTDPSLQIFDIERMMKLSYLLRIGRFSLKYFEVGCESIVGDERMYHFSSFSFHGMFFAELILSDILVV